MTHVQQLAEFVHRASWEEMSNLARDAIKIRVLDSLGCAFGAVDAAPISLIRDQTIDFGGNPLSTLIGGGCSAPDRAAFLNGSLVRYLDFNDIYLAKGETCHPSDNMGAVLAVAEYDGSTGKEFLTSLAVAYQVQCRLSDVAPVRARGFDHVTQGSFSVAAGVSKALGLDPQRTAHALAIAGTAYNAIRVTRTGQLSNWKGLAFPDTGRSALHATFLAYRGITGPLEVFEGNKGWRESISGPWELDWSKEDLERVTRTDLKKYNAEAHSQSAIEGLLELKEEHQITAKDIASIRIAIFDVAFNIIGGGEEGEKTTVNTKEQADHSLPYMLAVAALDGQVLPAQYSPERIQRQDVQDLLRKITVVPDPEYSRRFPEEHCCKITLTVKSNAVYEKEKTDYEGFHTRPMSWEMVEKKFRSLSQAFLPADRQRDIVERVRRLEEINVTEFTRIIGYNPYEPEDSGCYTS